MDINFKCSNCGKRYTVPAKLAGKQSKCECGALLVIPQSTVPATVQENPTPAKEATQLASENPNGFSGINPQANMPHAGLSSTTTGANPLSQLPTPPPGSPLPIQGSLPNAPNMQGWSTENQTSRQTKPAISKKHLIAISSGAIALIAILLLLVLLMGDDGNETNLADSGGAKPVVAEDAKTPSPKTSQGQDDAVVNDSIDSEMNVNGVEIGSSEVLSDPQAMPSAIKQGPPGDPTSTEDSTPFAEPSTPPAQPEPSSFSEAGTSPPTSSPEDAPSFVNANDVYSVIEKLEYPLPKFVGLEGGSMRTWKASAGDYTIDGVFDGLRIVNGEPEIAIKSAENEITIPKSKLSSEDRIWVTANGHHDFMAHAIQAAKNVEEKYRRYTPDDFESPCPFDVDWVTGIPELWGPVYDVHLVSDARKIAEGYYNGKYIRLNGFLDPRDQWAATDDGLGRISIFSQGSKSLPLIWNKGFVDAELGGYTEQTMFELVINNLADRFPGILTGVVERYGAAGAVVFFKEALPVCFDMQLIGKLDESGSFVYAQTFVLKLKHFLGEPTLYGKDEIGYRGVFAEELRRWLALIKARVMETADPNGDGTIHSEEHAIGYYEDVEGSGVNIDSLISSLRSLAALNALNINMNKFSRLVCQFKKVDQDNDGRIKIGDYAGAFWHEGVNLSLVNEAITLTEEHRQGLRLLLRKGVRPKVYPRFVKTFKKAMYHLELHVRSKDLTITSNPYLNKKPTEMREILDSRGAKQADFGLGVYDLLLRRETAHFQSLLASPLPVSDVLQYSDFSNDGHYFKAYVGQKEELGWLISHITLMDTKLVEILPLQSGKHRLPAGKGHIYRFTGPYGTLNLWIDGILEKNYNLRALFWDHAVNKESSEHLWIWKEGNIEKYARGKLTNVYWRDNKMMLVIQTDEGETIGVPMYQMPQETQRFARWALAYLRTDKLYKDRGIIEGPKVAIAVEENTVSTSSTQSDNANQIIAMADTRYIGDRNGKSSHVEIMVAYYYDNVKNVQFDEKEVEKDGKEVYSETVALTEENTGDLFLYNLPDYGGEETGISTEDIYRNEGMQ